MWHEKYAIAENQVNMFSLQLQEDNCAENIFHYLYSYVSKSYHFLKELLLKDGGLLGYHQHGVSKGGGYLILRM